MNVMIKQDEGNTQRWCRWFVEASVGKAVGDEQSTPSLETLADYVKKTLPLLNPAAKLELNRKAGVVVFPWYAQKFVVTPSLQVFELQGTKLLITSPAMLIQAVLAKQDKYTRAVKALVDSIEKAQALLKTKRSEMAYSLLESVKQTFLNQNGMKWTT